MDAIGELVSVRASVADAEACMERRCNVPSRNDGVRSSRSVLLRATSFKRKSNFAEQRLSERTTGSDRPPRNAVGFLARARRSRNRFKNDHHACTHASFAERRVRPLSFFSLVLAPCPWAVAGVVRRAFALAVGWSSIRGHGTFYQNDLSSVLALIRISSFTEGPNDGK